MRDHKLQLLKSMSIRPGVFVDPHQSTLLQPRIDIDLVALSGQYTALQASILYFVFSFFFIFIFIVFSFFLFLIFNLTREVTGGLGS